MSPVIGKQHGIPPAVMARGLFLRGLLGPRRKLYLLLAAPLLLVLLVWAVKTYVGSRRVAEQVAERISQALGMPIEIARVDIHLNSISLEGVKLFQPGSDTSSQPWAEVRSADLDVSPWDMIHGRDIPRRVVLRGTTVTCNVDVNGIPQTPMHYHQAAGPGPAPAAPSQKQKPAPLPRFPNLDIEDARLLLKQPGKPDIEITGIDILVRSREEWLILSGTVLDELWGSWTMSGSLNRADEKGSASIRSLLPVHVRREMLYRIPFVVPEVLNEVQIEGSTPVEVAFQYDLGHLTAHYRASLEPTATMLRVPSIELSVDDIHGKLVVEDGILHLKSLEGKAQGGDIVADGDLNFFKPGMPLRLGVTVQNWDVQRLPKSWGFPPEVKGNLTGDADFRTTFVNNKAMIRSQGQGVIHEAKVLKVPLASVPLTMKVDETGIHFQVR